MKCTARILCLVFVLSVISGLMPALATSSTVFVAVNNQKFYSSPSESAKVVGTMGYGDSVVCTNIKDDWAYVKSGEDTAYCPLESLTSEDPNTLSQAAFVTSADAKFYKRPTDDSVSKALKVNAEVTIIAITPDKKWCRVKYGERTGYVMADHIDDEKTDENSVKMYVGDTLIKVYKSSTRTSEVIAYSGYGAKLNCVEIDGDWVKVKSGSKYGWVRKDGLVKKNPNKLDEKGSAKSKIKVREYPSSSADSLGTVAKGSKVNIIAKTPDGKWYRIKSGEKRGYVEAADIALSGNSKIDAVLKIAAQQLGKPYVYATRGPNSFDCTGLTIYCFKNYTSVELGRSAELQGYNEKLTKVETMDNIRVGDIVCFNTDEKDEDLTDHVGIYLGDGKFVHASSAKGKVIVSDMSSGYYKRVFSWGRRVID